MLRTGSAAICLSIILGCAIGQQVLAAGPGRAVVPANGAIVLTEYGYRNWGPELVHYQIDTRAFQPGKLALLNPSGTAIPFQITGNTLSFVAALKKNQSVTYTLQASATDRSGENSTVTSQVIGDILEIGNDKFTLRVPKVHSQAFPTPMKMGQVPVPLLGIKHAGKSWYGGSHFATARQFASYAFNLVENGKASITYEARYRFAPTGEYVCRIQVSHTLPYPLFTEEFDFGVMTAGQDFLVLDIASGWSPDTYRHIWCGFGGGEMAVGQNATGGVATSPLSSYISEKATAWAKWPALQPRPYNPGPPSTIFLDNVTHTGSFGPRAAVGLSNASQSIYILPMHGGIWRRAMSMTVWNDPSGGVKIALPISTRYLHESTETTGDGNPFFTGLHDPGVPPSYGRRMWALCIDLSDDAVANVRTETGVIGLDRYKNWILNWQYDASKTFPRSETTPALVNRLRNSLNSHPEKDKLKTCYVITGNTQQATDNANTALKALRQSHEGRFLIWAFIAYREPDFGQVAIRAEDALSCPSLASSLRDELRLRLAFLSHFYAEPDIVPMGSGAHLGTMNMRVHRLLAGIEFASLLPDHPSYDYWMEHYRVVTGFSLGTMETVGGAWHEPPLYQTYGPTRALSTAQVILRNGGVFDYGPKGYWARLLQYNADITMRDPRYAGKRIFPGIADGGNTLEAMFGIGQGVVESSDPASAKFFSYMHGLVGIHGILSRSNNFGSDNPDFSFLYMNDVGIEYRDLTTTYIPGFGVSFRAHSNSPDETALNFRCGYTRSHWDADDMNVILYGKGAPLSPGHSYQYWGGPIDALGSRYNQCRMVDVTKGPANGRIHSDIQDYGFGANADYALGRMYFSGEELGDGKGEMEWRRQILFLKSPRPTGANYFVMRDMFTGYEGAPASTGRTAWWNWLNLGDAGKVKVNGRAFDPAQVAVHAVTPESSWPALTGNTIEMGTDYGASSWFWFATPTAPTIKAVMKEDFVVAPADYQRDFQSLVPGIPTTSDKETKTIFRIQGNTDNGFCYVIYPRKGSEATPQCSRLTPGVLKVVTSESTDFIFVGGEAFDYDAGGIRFTGKAGAVRVFSDRVVFCMNSGTGTIGYKGHILNGSGPFERTVRNANLTPGATNVLGTPKVIQTVKVGADMTVTGEGPFTALFNGSVLSIHTEGRARRFTVENLPSSIRNPQFLLDGQEWLCLKADAASQGWGTYARSNGVAFSTVDGSHDLILRERIWPSPWDCGISPTVAPNHER